MNEKLTQLLKEKELKEVDSLVPMATIFGLLDIQKANNKKKKADRIEKARRARIPRPAPRRIV